MSFDFFPESKIFEISKSKTVDQLIRKVGLEGFTMGLRLALQVQGRDYQENHERKVSCF